jgi:hypothetical protein
MFGKLKATVAWLLAFLDTSEIPLNAENKAVAFTEDQEAKLKAKLGDDLLAKMKIELNKQIEAHHDDNLELKAIQDELDALTKETNLTEEELKKIAGSGEKGDKSILAQVQEFTALVKKQEATIQKLIKEDDDSPEAVIKKHTGDMVKHSATHLFASGKEYDKLDRPWNARVLNPSVGATNYSDSTTIEKLQGDLDLYYRENPTSIKSLHRDDRGLPSFWPTRTKVDDRVADGTIAVAEITQARKLPWLPKNRELIKPEEGKIFPIQIDIEFVGVFLQKIEASWLNMMNREGSQPFKDSFVRFLVSELDKKARLEDRQATINGIYVETPENATEGGRFINRQNGLKYLLKRARDIDKKYRAFDIGMPTATNIVDYVDEMIKRLPDEVRTTNGLVYYLSEDWHRAYKRRYEAIYGGNNDYNGYPETPKDYPNVRFEHLYDMAGSDFMFITFDDNIEILENIPAEKSMYRFDKLKRNTFIYADYKLGVRLIHIGNKVEEGDPLEFKVQTVWSNTAPIFRDDVFVPLHETGSGIVSLPYNNIYVTTGRTTNITDLENFAEYKGQVIKIKGNTGVTGSPVVTHNAGKIALAGNANFNLNSGGTLTLFVPLTGVPFELNRTAGPATVEEADVNFTTGVIDANLGSVFVFTGTTTTAVTSILNGYPGKTIKLVGKTGVDLTLSEVGNIFVNSAATLNAPTDTIELTLVDGIWRETKRTIA